MVKFAKLAVVALTMSALVVGLSSCKKDDPAEQAGKKVDTLVDEAKQNLEKAGDDMKDAAKRVRDR